MKKFIVLLFITFTITTVNANQDTSKKVSANYLSLKKGSKNKLSQVALGSKVIVKTPICSCGWSVKKNRYKGLLTYIGGESLMIEKRTGKVEEIKFSDIDLIHKHYGYGTRFWGNLIVWGGLITTAGSVVYESDYAPELLPVTLVVGLGGVYLAHKLKGKKYKMRKWKIVPNVSGE